MTAKAKIIRGIWEQAGQIYRDESARVFVDVPDLPENRQFFVEFKERLKDRFKQLDIYITSYPVDVL